MHPTVEKRYSRWSSRIPREARLSGSAFSRSRRRLRCGAIADQPWNIEYRGACFPDRGKISALLLTKSSLLERCHSRLVSG